MILSDFIKQTDKPESIVLLEGKRKVLNDDREKLIKLGRLLAENTQFIMFRSGNAAGADELFAEGVASVDPNRMQVIIPYSSHRKKANKDYDTISLDDIDLAQEPDIVNQSRSHKKTANLIDRYVVGDRDRYAMNAAYIIRDTIKVLGTGLIGSAIFGIFYDDLSDPMQGGTGHTMNVCIENNVPICNQQVWFEWLKKNNE